MLHIINQSPISSIQFTSCLRLLLSQQSLLLIEDGVYALKQNTFYAELLKQRLATTRIYALLPDIKARGIEDKIIPDISLINYEEFVELTVQHKTICSWN